MTIPTQPGRNSGPQRVDSLGRWPLHDAASSRDVEREALAGCTPHALMERAGLGVARLALALAPHAARIAVLAGPGNNGGDGLVAARHLKSLGKSVHLHLLADEGALSPDAEWALDGARHAGVAIVPGLSDALDGGLLIDGLLGLGGSRPLEGQLAEAAQLLNASAAPILAIDLPSGLDADTGQPHGATVVRAQTTLSLLTLKPGLFTAEGRELAGSVWFDDLDTVPTVARTAWLDGAADARRLSRPRRHASHKGSYGDVAVVGGAPGMTGAAWLAARAALAAGAGRVYASLLDERAAPADPQRPELMCHPAWWKEGPERMAHTTVVCGCGGGSVVAAVLAPLIGRSARLVLDADALNAVAADPDLQSRLERRGGRGEPTVLTPHPLEAARLLGVTGTQVQQDRVAAARALAERFGAVVVLKGSGSVTAEPEGSVSINNSGNAMLASPGTGDVLSGWIGGLWSANADTATPVEAARAAVWLHGHAADRAAASGSAALPLRAADLIDAMRGAAVF